MKKTLVALAALAVVGAVSAQSTVTLYGRIDASLGQQTIKSTNAFTAAADAGWYVGSGVNSGSRWGMRGSEDLGGGLKANFVLESGINVDAGSSAQGGLLFGRTAAVGLSGGFGSVDIGRQLTVKAVTTWATTGGYANYSAFSRSTATAFGNRASVTEDAVRKNNSILYASPSMSGFMARLMWAPGENGIANGAGATNYVSGGLSYAAGPLAAHLVFENDKVAPGGANIRENSVSASYDLGVASLGMSIVQGKSLTVKDKGMSFSVGAPIGPMTLGFEYAREKTTTAGAFSSKANAWNARLGYPLSKRTSIYALVNAGKAIDPAGEVKLQNFSLGMIHNF